MSRMKRFLESVSEDMGYSGTINDEVLKKAQEVLESQGDRIEHINRISKPKENDD